MYRSYFMLFTLVITVIINSCKKDQGEITEDDQKDNQRELIFKFQFDSTQVRLDNFGKPSGIPSGNSAQSPLFNTMSAHYIELSPNSHTALAKGEVLYWHEETSEGGGKAINFQKSILKGDGEVFHSLPLSEVPEGTYEWLRVSLAYQNYDIKYKSGNFFGTGTLASFIGYNTYIKSHKIKNETIDLNANKLQGYWAFETNVAGTSYVFEGQAPAGATTVPNPIAGTSPIPEGSCVITGKFVNDKGEASPLKISHQETQDIVITVSLSVNKSFEWKDVNGDGHYEPSAGDTVVDMGVRGLIPYIGR